MHNSKTCKCKHTHLGIFALISSFVAVTAEKALIVTHGFDAFLQNLLLKTTHMIHGKNNQRKDTASKISIKKHANLLLFIRLIHVVLSGNCPPETKNKMLVELEQSITL